MKLEWIPVLHVTGAFSSSFFPRSPEHCMIVQYGSELDNGTKLMRKIMWGSHFVDKDRLDPRMEEIILHFAWRRTSDWRLSIPSHANTRNFGYTHSPVLPVCYEPSLHRQEADLNFRCSFPNFHENNHMLKFHTL